VKKNRYLWLLPAMLAASMWSTPAFAGKEALSDERLDEITAGGESMVAVAEADGPAGVADANLVDNAEFSLDIPSDAQKGLRALTVQNVVGEVQLLVNLNVLAASQNVAGTDQRNFSVQSWGSTAPLAVATVPGQPAGNGGNAASADGGAGGTATGGAGGNITLNGTSCGGCCDPCCSSCSGGSALVNTGNSIGGNATSNGGDGAAAPGGNGGNAAPGLISVGIGSGDMIAHAAGSLEAQADIVNNAKYSLALEPNAQVDLATLFVANVVGRAQTAFNINIAAATLNLVPDAGEPFATPMQNATGVIKQVNSGVQFRGTPLGVGNTSATVTVTHTPN
jgi:hypothetical protein